MDIVVTVTYVVVSLIRLSNHQIVTDEVKRSCFTLDGVNLNNMATLALLSILFFSGKISDA